VSIQDRIKVVEVVALQREPPVVVEQDTDVRTVVARMREARVGCAMVTESGRLTGIFTERDLLMKVLGHEGGLDWQVAKVMTPNPISIGDHEFIRQAVAKMVRGGFRHLPIVDKEGHVLGCVRHRDMVSYLVANFADRALNVPPDPDQTAKAPDGA
jgi:CBS domain-containing protein